MENTIENKERFIAQYFNQFVMRFPNNSDTLKVIDWFKFKDAYLELKPLSMITDEDAIEVSHLNTWIHPNRENPEIFVNAYGHKVVKTSNHFKYGLFCIKEEYLTPHQTDFLRSKGYALHFMGLSVEQQIDYGWIKLKTE